jgi:hypothetical protein
MRTLGMPPSAALDPVTRLPAWGSYRGSLPRTDLGKYMPGRLQRLLTEKRWVWGGVVLDDLLIAFAVVDLGYATNGFAYAFSPTDGIVAGASALGVPGLCRVAQTAEHRIDARFRHPGLTIRVLHRDDAPDVWLDVASPRLRVDARLRWSEAPPSITAIAPLDGDRLNITEKRVLLPTSGTAWIDGRARSLDGALAGLDLTHGLHPRHTRWKWAFFMGRTADRTPVAVNLVEGWTGAPECAAWVGSELFGVAEAAFDFDAQDLMRPWSVKTHDQRLDLVMRPRAAHSDVRNLGLVRSNFKQVIGTYSGELRLGARALSVRDALGVGEVQDIRW